MNIYANLFDLKKNKKKKKKKKSSDELIKQMKREKNGSKSISRVINILLTQKQFDKTTKRN